MKKILILLFIAVSASAQNNTAYLQYINQYAGLAIDQMRRYNIPASITLAQGLHESSAGRSRLAVEGNNHFGIKTGGSWTGPDMEQRDDKPNDRFRVYASVKDSYEDHSLFLLKDRYKPLFSLSRTDYKGWANGLKQCGYATNPSYAQCLIKIIEDYELYHYDSEYGPIPAKAEGKAMSRVDALAEMGIGMCNSNYYVIVADGESLASIARRTGVSPTRLVKYNELSSGYVITVGDRLYLKKKRTKADKSLKGCFHTVLGGESMHYISQLYGMRLSTLYKTNNLPASYVPRPGDTLKLR